MYCVSIFSLELEKVVRFYWVSTHRRANKLVRLYGQRVNLANFAIAIEANFGPCATIEDACRY